MDLVKQKKRRVINSEIVCELCSEPQKQEKQEISLLARLALITIMSNLYHTPHSNCQDGDKLAVCHLLTQLKEKAKLVYKEQFQFGLQKSEVLAGDPQKTEIQRHIKRL